MSKDDPIILGIESSCDDTSAAVIRGPWLLSNVTASQEVHRNYGGVVPELASRAHQQNIVPTVDEALRRAQVKREELAAIAFTRGPGLLGSLLVGVSFAKGLSVALNIPLVDVNHLQGHILAHFISEEGKENRHPEFPFICLLVSGGNSQIVRVDSYSDMTVLGQTIDDAAGETIDEAFRFNKPHIPGLDYSFSGLKTSLLYFIRDRIKENPDFIEENKEDLAASFEKAVVDSLMNKLELAVKQTGIRRIALSGGVSANTRLREAFLKKRDKGWDVFIPPFSYTTDNAAMIAIAGYYKYLSGQFCQLDQPAYSRVTIK